MKARPIHLALQISFCTLAICARDVYAQEATTPEQSSYNSVEEAEAIQHDGVTSEQPREYEYTETIEHDDRRGDHSEQRTTENGEYMASSTSEQSRYFEATEANEYDDRTLLDTFGQAAKEFLTKRVIPDTDSECK